MCMLAGFKPRFHSRSFDSCDDRRHAQATYSEKEYGDGYYTEMPFNYETSTWLIGFADVYLIGIGFYGSLLVVVVDRFCLSLL